MCNENQTCIVQQVHTDTTGFNKSQHASVFKAEMEMISTHDETHEISVAQTSEGLCLGGKLHF